MFVILFLIGTFIVERTKEKKNRDKVAREFEVHFQAYMLYHLERLTTR